MWRSDYIEGIGRRGDSFVVIFDVSRLLSSEDVALLHAGAPRAAQSAMSEA
jgi:purine-binding chemotaxis protein CheW